MRSSGSSASGNSTSVLSRQSINIDHFKLQAIPTRASHLMTIEEESSPSQSSFSRSFTKETYPGLAFSPSHPSHYNHTFQIMPMLVNVPPKSNDNDQELNSFEQDGASQNEGLLTEESFSDLDSQGTTKNMKHVSFSSILIDLLITILALGIVIGSMVIRGDHDVRSIIGIGSFSVKSWLILLGSQLLCVGLTLISYQRHARRLLKACKTDKKSHLIRKVVLVSYFSGIFAGLLGTDGGGMVLNPLFFQMGLIPEVAAAISSFSLLYSATSSTAQFAIQGMIAYKDSPIFLLFSGLGAIIGRSIISHAIEKYKRPSIIIWIICFMIGLSAFLLPIDGALNIITHGFSFQINKPC